MLAPGPHHEGLEAVVPVALTGRLAQTEVQWTAATWNPKASRAVRKTGSSDCSRWWTSSYWSAVMATSTHPGPKVSQDVGRVVGNPM